MKKKLLRPLVHKDDYTRAFEKALVATFSALIVDRLFDIMEGAPIVDDSTLGYALATGRISYKDGAFRGSFGGPLSKELRALGAEWDFRNQTFALPALPRDLARAVRRAEARREDVYAGLIAFLVSARELYREADQRVTELAPLADGIVLDLNVQWEKIAEGLEAPKTPIRNLVEEAITDASKLNEVATEEAIEDITRVVEDSHKTGKTLEEVTRMIRYEVAGMARKLGLVAERTASLLVARYRRQRAVELGCTSYIWTTMHDERVRHSHSVLDGRTFFWDSPPVVDGPTSRRCHPGEDYGCRCSAIFVALDK
jgi:SPP1 gp7 family putative phage head morphogenesis protein